MGTCSFTESQGNPEVRDFQGPLIFRNLTHSQYEEETQRKRLIPRMLIKQQ